VSGCWDVRFSGLSVAPDHARCADDSIGLGKQNGSAMPGRQLAGCGRAQNRAEKEQRVREGRTHAALGGALAEIAGHGGGTVEGYPEETDDRTLSGTFLHTGPMAAFEHHGFARTRRISPHR